MIDNIEPARLGPICDRKIQLQVSANVANRSRTSDDCAWFAARDDSHVTGTSVPLYIRSC